MQQNLDSTENPGFEVSEAENSVICGNQRQTLRYSKRFDSREEATVAMCATDHVYWYLRHATDNTYQSSFEGVLYLAENPGYSLCVNNLGWNLSTGVHELGVFSEKDSWFGYIISIETMGKDEK